MNTFAQVLALLLLSLCSLPTASAQTIIGQAELVGSPISQDGDCDYFPDLTADGLAMYFNPCRDDVAGVEDRAGGEDIYVSTRDSLTAPWSIPARIAGLVNEPNSREMYPDISGDGLTLTFRTNRTSGALEVWDFWASTRPTINDPWDAPFPIDELNTPYDDRDPDTTPDGLSIFFARWGDVEDRQDADIFEAQRNSPDEPWGTPVRIGKNVNSESDDFTNAVSPSGRVLLFATFRDGAESGDIYVSTRVDRHSAWSSAVPLALPFDIEEGVEYPGDIAPDGYFYFGRSTGLTHWDNYDIWRVAIRGPADFDNNGTLDDVDVTQLTRAVNQGSSDLKYDVFMDGVVNERDVNAWISDLKRTYFGDVNLDGVFGSDDLVEVFQAGHYEDSVARNSTWGTGDWDGDAEFTTSDLVLAFQDGGYEVGPRAAAPAVPEPSSLVLLIAGVCILAASKVD